MDAPLEISVLEVEHFDAVEARVGREVKPHRSIS